MLKGVLKVLSYGKSIEKYALSAQAIAKAFKTLDTDLQEIWGKTDAVKAEPVKSVKKVIKEVVKDKKDKETSENEKG
ncbi:hypothetical protein [Flagellimonas sp.]|uniref:hypothetical protein n=1 Tax=Flagellimonas sp. TaxID=2058762 RepID=UPI003C79ADB3